MTQTITEATPAPASSKSVPVIITVVAAVLAAAAALLLQAGDHFVPVVRIHNPSPLPVDVDVTGAQRDGWTPVTVSQPEKTTTAREVSDQGDTWIFRFRFADQSGGEVVRHRAELERSNWNIRIPDAVIARLRSSS